MLGFKSSRNVFSLLILLLLTLLIIVCVSAANDLTCFFLNSKTCPAGTAKLIGVRNDTDGFQNAHAQNNTLDTYNYSVCCNVTTNSSINITSTCPGNATLLKLSNHTNAHVEIGTNSNYSIAACLGSDWKYVTCAFLQGSCGAGYNCVLSMANSEGPNSTNAHVGNCSHYNQKVCCKLENKAPTRPTLYYPANGNTSVFERKPNFNWSTATDPDGDTVDYTLNLTCGSGCACADIDVDSLSSTNYTVSNDLCIDTLYNWTVSACDPYNDCNTSAKWNFTIASVAELELIVNSTNFGEMNMEENNDTTDDSPNPLVVRNIGNVYINVSLNSTVLFEQAGLNMVYYQYKADENESNSYDQACSQHSAFANMQASLSTIFCNLSYEDANDEGEIELNITVPVDEPPGAKSSTIKVVPASTE